jgi:CubicO group peptidase (beta-lactamase class C family)
MPSFIARAATVAWAAALIATPVAAQPDRDVSAYAPFLDSLMAAADVPGLAIAFFDSDGILGSWVRGVKSTATGEPIKPATVFEAASISKPVFARLLLGLAEEGAVDLDAPLEALGTPPGALEPGLANDARAGRLTPAVLLSHQGGLPNWRTRINLDATGFDDLFGPEDRLTFTVDPGTGHLYSGEGYLLLQRALERRTGEPLASLARGRVFEPLGMTRTSFSFDTVAQVDYAMGHLPDGTPDKFGLRATLASSTLHSTAPDLARFGVSVARALRAGGPIAAIGEPRVEVAEAGDTRASWGLGLGVLDTPDGRWVYHGGNNVIFIADFIYGVDADFGYVLLTNSANGQALVGPLAARVFGRELRR